MAASQVETVSSGADKAKLFAVAALVVAAVAGFYFMASRAAISSSVR
jgi:preprotein translocase subunit SecE